MAENLDYTITDKIYIDLGQCGERTSAYICRKPSGYGRIVIGLYGNLVPETCANMKSAFSNEVYDRTAINSVVKGQYIRFGRQGRLETGGVSDTIGMSTNQELLTSRAFQAKHVTPGTVSWAVGANDDREGIRSRFRYISTQFLITTGPGPVPSLDGSNIVVGRVIEGIEIIQQLAKEELSYPPGIVQAANSIATGIGVQDIGLSSARQFWEQPKKPVVVLGTGKVE